MPENKAFLCGWFIFLPVYRRGIQSGCLTQSGWHPERERRVQKCQSVWSFSVKGGEVREVLIERSNACPVHTVNTPGRHTELYQTCEMRRSHQTAWLYLPSRLGSAGSLWISSCLLCLVSALFKRWPAFMEEYGGLRVPARSYSRFSCKKFKLVRN